MRLVSAALAVIFLVQPVAVLSECNPKDDGNCCARDADCAAFANRALCAVMALNRIEIAELEKENSPSLGFCTDEVMRKLKETAAQAKVVCIEGGCEIWQDNG